jgi:membrane protease YdiL (CAAX protease family)
MVALDSLREFEAHAFVWAYSHPPALILYYGLRATAAQATLLAALAYCLSRVARRSSSAALGEHTNDWLAVGRASVLAFLVVAAIVTATVYCQLSFGAGIDERGELLYSLDDRNSVLMYVLCEQWQLAVVVYCRTYNGPLDLRTNQRSLGNGLVIGGALVAAILLVTLWTKTGPTYAVRAFVQSSRQIEGHIGLNRVSIVALFAWTLVVAPVVEEYLFRGQLQSYFAHAIGKWGAVLAQAILFAVMHFSMSGLLPFTLLGLLLGIITAARRSLVLAIVLHATYNAVMLLR